MTQTTKQSLGQPLGQPFGASLREWRQRRGLSQLDLAVASEVSQRHISFLETGRSKPSREMVGHLARQLRISPREHNAMLLAAGFAPSFSETPPEDLGEVGDAIDFLLRAHEPNMAIVIDRHWNLMSSNTAADRFVGALLDDIPLYEGRMNAMLLMFHPDGFRRHLMNFAEVAPALLWRLHGDLDRQPTDEGLRHLIEHLEELAGPDVRPSVVPPDSGLVLTVHFDVNGDRLRMFSCLAALESPIDVTVSELRIETFFPADEESRETWRTLVANDSA